MASLFFAASSATADPTASGTFKDCTSGASTTLTNGSTITFDSRGTGKIAPASAGNLDQSNVSINDIWVDQSFGGEAGDGTNYWQLSPLRLWIGQRSGGQTSGSGTPRFMLKNASRTMTLGQSAGTATATLGVSHGWSTGQAIVISGAVESDYNGSFTLASTPATNTLTFAVANNPSSPASGSPIITRCCTATVADSCSTSTDSYYGPIQLVGVGWVINQSGGNISLAPRNPETAGVISHSTVKGSGQAVSNPLAYYGQNATTATLNALAGSITSRSDNALTTATLSGTAIVETLGGGAVTTATVNTGATLYHSGSGNVTTLNVYGTFDRTRDTRTITLGTTNLFSGSSFLLDNGKAGSTVRTTVNLNGNIQNLKSLTMPATEVL